MSILHRVYDLKSYRRGWGGTGAWLHAIAMNLTIVFAEIVNFAPNNYFHTDVILATPLLHDAQIHTMNKNTHKIHKIHTMKFIAASLSTLCEENYILNNSQTILIFPLHKTYPYPIISFSGQ